MRASASNIVSFLVYLKEGEAFEDESALRVLLQLGYENEVFFLLASEHYTASPQLLITALHHECFVVATLLMGRAHFRPQENPTSRSAWWDSFHRDGMQLE